MALPTLVIIGLIISIIIFLYNRGNIYLSIFYLLTSLNGLLLYLTFLTNWVTFPAIFIVHSFPIFLLYGPILWFYVRGEISGELRIQQKDLWHFIPFAINLIQIIPYALKPWSYKLFVVSNLKKISFVGIQDLNLPWINLPTYFIFKNLIFYTYLFLCFVYFKNNLTKTPLIKTPFKIKWLKWFFFVNIIANLSINICTIVDKAYFKTSSPGTIGILMSIFFGTLFISTFFFPKILYGEIIKNVPVDNNLNPPSEIQLAEFAKILEKYVDKRQYVHGSFSKSKILADSGVSDRLFTYYFNEHLQSSFTQWRNDHRLDFSMKLISEGYLKNHTIESLAKVVGFQSRSTFRTLFKGKFGFLPSDKIKST